MKEVLLGDAAPGLSCAVADGCRAPNRRKLRIGLHSSTCSPHCHGGMAYQVDASNLRLKMNSLLVFRVVLACIEVLSRGRQTKVRPLMRNNTLNHLG